MQQDGLPNHWERCRVVSNERNPEPTERVVRKLSHYGSSVICDQARVVQMA